MHDLKRIALLVVMVALATVPVRGEEPGREGDPWKGKTRDEVVEQLGEPNKNKKAGRDGETLTYKFFRMNPTDIGRSGLRVMPVPGVGLVGVKAPGAGDDTPMSIGPTEFDGETGRPAGGGISTSESVSRTYDPETDKMVVTGDTPGNTPARKIKMVFVLDANGRVKDWSVAGNP
jgi:hypothetical protein